MCGKNTVKIIVWQGQVGSPPRVREKPLLLEDNNPFIGITPACAGKTTIISLRVGIIRDHPRVCGKNLSSNFTDTEGLGSPPRVREKQTVLVSVSQSYGITPACAGKTTQRSQCYWS